MNVTIGACDWALPGSGLNATRIAADYGLKALSLQAGYFKNKYPIFEKEMQEYFLQDKERYGIEYVAIALNDFDNIPMHAGEDTQEYEKVWYILKNCVKAAVNLQIPLIQVPGFAASEIRDEQDYEYSKKCLQYLCDEAAKYDIVIGYESLLGPEEFKKLADMVNRKNFGLYYDSQNYSLFKGYDQIKILEEMYPYMVNQIHVKDGNNAMSGALLGKGDSNFNGTIDFLKKKNFQGYILLENYYDQLPLRLEDENPYNLLEEDINILKKAIEV